MTILRSETAKRRHAEILCRVAARALGDARKAWRKARATPGEKHTRMAFRTCVFAARALRSAAEVVAQLEAEQMIAVAVSLDAAADELKIKLAHIIEA